jgi:hypothetical protein
MPDRIHGFLEPLPGIPFKDSPLCVLIIAGRGPGGSDRIVFGSQGVKRRAIGGADRIVRRSIAQHLQIIGPIQLLGSSEREQREISPGRRVERKSRPRFIRSDENVFTRRKSSALARGLGRFGPLPFEGRDHRADPGQ